MDYEAKDLRCPGSKSNANTELAHALTHGKGQHAIQANAREYERERPEYAKHAGHELAGANGAVK
jgi:hypothetical protein